MKKLFLILAMILVSFTTNAQVYNYEYSYSGDCHFCQTKDDNCLYTRYSDDLFDFGHHYIFAFTLRASNAKPYLDIIFDIPELIVKFEEIGKELGENIVINNKSMKLTGDLPIKIQLSNGDILRSTDNGILYGRCVYLGTDVITVNNKKYNDNGYYVMSLIRTYDVVEIVVDGVSIKAPIHTADTFDAMCKTLMSKAGDKWQYGKRLTSGKAPAKKSQTTTTTPAPSINKTRQTNTSKPSTTTTTTSGFNLKGLVKVSHKDKYNRTAESLQRNVHNFTAYDLMEKIMGVIEKPSKNLDFNTVFSKLRKAYPEMSEISKKYGNDYEFDNLTIRCNNVTAFPEITFENGKYSKVEYDMFFNNMKEAVRFAKQIKADIESHGYSLEVYKEKSNNCVYGLYMEGLHLSIMTITYKYVDAKCYVVKITTEPFSYK